MGRRLVVPLLLSLVLLTGCGNSGGDSEDPAQVDATQAPDLGACRLLTPDEVAKSSNATRVVTCTKPHTAQTYAVGPLPNRFTKASYDDDDLAAYAYQKCSHMFIPFTGADESLAMRTVLSWAWFRPSQTAWDNGARWYRCDVIGGGDQSRSYVDLPKSAKGLLLGRPADQWMVCAQGGTVSGSVKLPCNQKHTWRAVTTIVLGEGKDTYPGDRVVQVRTRDFCSKSVGAFLGYPINYDYGYSWFHRAEWDAGNRRSVCWARTGS